MSSSLGLSPGGPPRVTKRDVLAKCEYFTRVQLWPLKTKLDPEGWLSNFLPSEEEHAVHLLNGFLYFSEVVVAEMFSSGFRALSPIVSRPTDGLLPMATTWRSFLSRVILVPVTGEIENPTDSGYLFARMARQVIGISESQVLFPADALKKLVSEGPIPVVFVDDFVGSGSQFTTTWQRPYAVSPGTVTSFENVSAIRGTQFFYCTVLCTESGKQNLLLDCPGVVVSAAHILTSRYNVFSPDSLVWPADLRTGATDFIRAASVRAGIPDTGGTHVDDLAGFSSLGLALAFSHSVPDATIGLLRWSQYGWKPLVHRT